MHRRCTLRYDWTDFESEFADLAAGRERYKIDHKLARWIIHFFGRA
jgi:hypothetical protein